MRFQLTHKLTTYLLVLAALGTLMSANLISTTAAALTLGFGAVSWFADPATRLAAMLGRAALLTRVCAIAFFAACAYQVWSRLPEPDLVPVLNLVLFLTVYKLFGRGVNRDYLQIYVLAFLLVLAAAAYAQSFLFAAGFTAYVILTVWTLILLHLRREMEENYLVKHSGQPIPHKVGVARILNSRRVVGAAFLAITAAVALAICAGSVVTFALVPRVGAGFTLGGPHARKSLVGFADEVTLGTSGFLSAEDETVAFRAVLPRLARLHTNQAREMEIDGLYWRGTVYDTYQRGHWLRSRSEALRTQLDDTNGPSLIREPHTRPKIDPLAPHSPLAATDRQEIDIVGVSAPVAFALDRPVAFEMPPPQLGLAPDLRLVPRWSGEVGFQNVSEGGLTPGSGPGSAIRSEEASAVTIPTELATFSGARYVAYSRDPFVMTAAASGLALAQIPPQIMAPYLAVPAALSPRVRHLADEIVAGKSTALAKVLAVTAWLQRTHEYSMNLGALRSPEQDPVEAFLFEHKAGHCEYFATSTAVLLRTVGVPTRYVNGFLGGEWNAVGQHVTVRQNRAHAWVEAYLGEFGWMRVDATPPMRPPGRMSKWRQLQDSLEFFWGRWVVGYDLGRQIDIVRDLGKGVGVPGGAPSETGARWPGKRVLGLVAIVLGAGGITAAGWRRRRRRREQAGGRAVLGGLTHQAVGRLYRRCLERLADLGLPRRPAETPREYADRLAAAAADLQGLAGFSRLTDVYVQARFGRKQIDEAVVNELARQVALLGRPGSEARPGRAA